MEITKTRVREAAELACILEATIPKPGNVSRFHDFPDTKYEHFLVSAVALGESVERSFKIGRGFAMGKEIKGKLGKEILRAIEKAKKMHKGKNTNLGIAMLLIPLSASLGAISKKEKEAGIGEKLNEISKNLVEIIKSTGEEDTLYLYRAIKLSNAEVGRSNKFDVHAKDSERKIIEKKMNLYKIFKISSWDNIAKELCSGMEITINHAYPRLAEEYRKTKDIKKAVLKTFFYILSIFPDTLIERKKGKKAAIKVSQRAGEIFESGLKEEEIKKFDEELRKEGNALNPGTTADLICSALMLFLLFNDVRV